MNPPGRWNAMLDDSPFLYRIPVKIPNSAHEGNRRLAL